MTITNTKIEQILSWFKGKSQSNARAALAMLQESEVTGEVKFENLVPVEVKR